MANGRSQEDGVQEVLRVVAAAASESGARRGAGRYRLHIWRSALACDINRKAPEAAVTALAGRRYEQVF